MGLRTQRILACKLKVWYFSQDISCELQASLYMLSMSNENVLGLRFLLSTCSLSGRKLSTTWNDCCSLTQQISIRETKRLMNVPQGCAARSAQLGAQNTDGEQRCV